MVSYVDWNVIQSNPKWLQGFSDMTGLTFLITILCDVATIYGNNFRTCFGMKKYHQSLKDNLQILSGNIVKQNSYDKYQNEYIDFVVGDEYYNLDTDVKWLNLRDEEEIVMHGRIIGGCLDILSNIIGTKYDKVKEFIEKYKDDGIIWYLDNCEQRNEDVTRLMWQFKKAGYFKYTKGIIFGRTARDESYYGISFKDTIKNSLENLNVPIILEADIGHKPPQMAIINGAITTIKSKDGKGSIEFELK